MITILEEVTSLVDQEVDTEISNIGDRGMTELDAAILLNVWDRAFQAHVDRVEAERGTQYAENYDVIQNREIITWGNLQHTVNL